MAISLPTAIYTATPLAPGSKVLPAARRPESRAPGYSAYIRFAQTWLRSQLLHIVEGHLLGHLVVVLG